MTHRIVLMTIAIGLGVLGSQPLSGTAPAQPAEPSGLLLDLLSVPLGIESSHPVMSWIVNHAEPNQYQTAYQIQVATTPRALEQDKPDTWDSGKILSAESSNARYAGPALRSNTVYFWRVRTWDRHDAVSPYSRPQMFVTDIRNEWQATPIWAAAEGAEMPNFAFLRQEFEVPEKEIAHAIVHVTATSPEPASQYVYRLYINGRFVGCGPERGFNDEVRYNTYEVSEYLNPGSNAIAALNYSTEDQKFILQMDIRFADGTTRTIASNESWRALNGDRIYVDGGNAGHRAYYHAPREFIQGPRYPFGWERSGFDDGAWPRAVEKEQVQNLRPSAQHNEQEFPIEPVRMIERAPGHYFLDFGRSLIGGFRLTEVVGEAGQEVEIRLGQELLGPQTVRFAKRTGNTYQEKWTLADGAQTLSNWGYRSFRYAEILGAPSGLSPANFQAVALRQPFDDTESSFESSDPVLNDIWEMLKYSIKATSLDVYVDTHSRERRNYEGDAYINQLSQYAVERQYAFPRYSIDYVHYRPTWPTEYKQISVMVAWNDYMFTGNADSLRAHYPILRQKTLEPFINADHLVEKPQDAGSPWGRDLVDWPNVLRDGYVFSDINTVVNAFNYRAVRLLGKIAGVIGEEEDARRYHELADHLQEAINEHLYDSEKGAFRDGKGVDHHSLHASILPVALGAAREEYLAPTAEHIFSRGMQCNLYGAQFVLEALYAAGRGDLALQRMNAIEGNSWGHMLYRLGATIATEAWDPSLKGNMTFSHGGWGSAPLNNIARGLFGIQPIEPGFARFQIRPQPGGLAWARYQMPSIKGPIRVEFITREDSLEMSVMVPVNTTADVYLPRMNKDHAAVAVNGEAKEGEITGEFVLIPKVGSGTHTFVR
jgi:alpha-L-rhamnosidase